MNRNTLVTLAMITGLGSMVAAPAMASPAMVAEAKKKGFPAQNCQYCHVSKAPKKDAFKPEDLNERGAFLEAEKAKHKAKTINVEWLKDYPGGKEQK